MIVFVRSKIPTEEVCCALSVFFELLKIGLEIFAFQDNMIFVGVFLNDRVAGFVALRKSLQKSRLE